METIESNDIDKIFSPSSYEESKSINQEKLWEKILFNLTEVLTTEFSDDNRHSLKIYKDRVSFACVYCGDSAKDSTKKRGNLFLNTLQYHCFNGDCKAHTSIYNFLNQKEKLLNFSLDEQLYLKQVGSERTINLKKIKQVFGLESFYSDEIEDLSVDRDFLMNKFRLQEIKGSRIERYLTQRLQKDFQKFGWDPRKGLLYVFNLTSSMDRIVGLQVKTFNKKYPYLTWKATKLHEQLGILKEENREQLEKMDFLSNIFGIFQVDLNKPITVFEGPLDSFLFTNAIALCSAKNSLPFEIEGARYFMDNDKTGIEWSIKRIQDGSPVFLWKKFLDENDLSIYSNKIKDLNDLLIFVKRHKKKCKRLIDYFSNNKHDIYFL